MSALEKFPRITPFLWFNANAEEAVDFYLSVFKNSRKLDVLHTNFDGGPVPRGSVLTIAFELDGLGFTALNGGPGPQFNESVSLDGALRLAGGGGLLLGETAGGRRQRDPVRMAEGQVRAPLAGCACTVAGLDQKSQGDAGDDEHEEV